MNHGLALFSIYCTFLSLLPFSSKAQETISTSSVPEIGNGIKLYYADSTTVTEGGAGADVVWDFSILDFTSGPFDYIFSAPATTPFETHYPEASLCSIDSSIHQYSYLQLSSDSLVQRGLVSDTNLGQYFVYTDVPALLRFLFSYGSNYTDSFKGYSHPADFAARRSTSLRLQHGDEHTYREGTISVYGDSYGTIHLPDGFSTSALRVKTIEQIYDSTDYNHGFNYRTDEITRTTYTWYNQNHKFPLLKIEYTYSLINDFIHSYSKRVMYFDVNTFTTSIKAEEELFPFSVYPNPAAGYFNVLYHLSTADDIIISVFDLNGREIVTFTDSLSQGGDYSHTFTNLQPGIYLIEIQTKKLRGRKKVIVF